MLYVLVCGLVSDRAGARSRRFPCMLVPPLHCSHRPGVDTPVLICSLPASPLSFSRRPEWSPFPTSMSYLNDNSAGCDLSALSSAAWFNAGRQIVRYLLTLSKMAVRLVASRCLFSLPCVSLVLSSLLSGKSTTLICSRRAAIAVHPFHQAA